MNVTPKSGPPIPVPPPPHLWFMPPRRVDAAQVMQLTGRKPRTLARWRAHGIDDVACLALLQAHAFGVLPHRRWQEYLIGADGTLNHWSGKRDLSGIHPVHLSTMCEAHRTARELRRDNESLRALVRYLQAQLELQHDKRAPAAAANDDAWQTHQLVLAWP